MILAHIVAAYKGILSEHFYALVRVSFSQTFDSDDPRWVQILK